MAWGLSERGSGVWAAWLRCIVRAVSHRRATMCEQDSRYAQLGNAYIKPSKKSDTAAATAASGSRGNLGSGSGPGPDVGSGSDLLSDVARIGPSIQTRLKFW